MRPRALVLGYHEMGCACLRALLRRGVDVAAVLTYEDDPQENRWFGSVAEVAREAERPVWTTDAINSTEWGERIAALEPDVIFSFHYRHLLGRPLLDLPRLGAINLHPSLLPRYRGRAPINWQLIHGERESGVTLHFMAPRADAGDIIGQERVGIGPDDTALDLYRRLLPAAGALLDRHLAAILDGTAPRHPQDESRATTFGRRSAEDGRIDWSRPAREIHDLVRAVAPPWPGAFWYDGDERVLVDRTRVVAPRTILEPGQVAIDGDRVLVGTGDSALELLAYRTRSGARLRAPARLGSR